MSHMDHKALCWRDHLYRVDDPVRVQGDPTIYRIFALQSATWDGQLSALLFRPSGTVFSVPLSRLEPVFGPHLESLPRATTDRWTLREFDAQYDAAKQRVRVAEFGLQFADIPPCVAYQADAHVLHPMLVDPALADLPLTVHAEPPAEGWYCESHA